MRAQDVSSRSALVRHYYRSRLFMGFCCVCCEVLYLALFLLHWPAARAWRPLPLRVPARLAAWLEGGAHFNCRGPCMATAQRQGPRLYLIGMHVSLALLASCCLNLLSCYPDGLSRPMSALLICMRSSARSA